LPHSPKISLNQKGNPAAPGAQLKQYAKDYTETNENISNAEKGIGPHRMQEESQAWL